jgi:PKD repeat protein
MRKLLALTTIVALPLVAGCAVHQDGAPSTTSGPAQSALSLKLTATPDSLLQDGSQSARIAITAFDPTGKAVAVNVRLSVSPSNFGTLSAATVATRADAANPTIVTYIPPASTNGQATTVNVQATLIDSNSATTGSSSNQVSLFLSPAGALAASAPMASFAVSPTLVTTGRVATFDASGSCGGQLVAGACAGTPALTNFTWNFGDGANGTGSIANHTFTATGNFMVTLTVTNDQGKQATTSQLLSVATVAPPVASYLVSPTTIHVGNNVNFNAAASAAAGGHTIVRYDWNFGDGSAPASTTTPSTTHIYGAINTFKSTLTVTDDVGQSATIEQDIAVVP